MPTPRNLNNDIAHQAHLEAWRTEVNGGLKEVTRSIGEVLLEVRQRPTRPEVETMLSTKVSVDIYNSEMKGIRDDITELHRKPEKFRAWISTVVAVSGCAFTIVSGLVSAFVSIGVVVLHNWPLK